MAPILKMASQHAKRFMLRTTIQTLPMRFANLPLPSLKHHRFQRPISTSRHTRREDISVGPPGGWGYTLFDCNYDLEIASRISYEASVLVNGQLDLLFPEDPKVVAEILNEGLFHQLLERFMDRDWNDEVVHLGALAMRSGAQIGEEDMRVLSKFVGCVKMYDQAREQMRAALKGYNTAGGYPWAFSCLGLLEEQVQRDMKGGECGSWDCGVLCVTDGCLH